MAEVPVNDNQHWVLTKTKKIGVPHIITPGFMHNKGTYTGSLGNLCRWLAEQAEGLGEFLDDPMKASKQMQDMHSWWRAGDVAKLDSELRAEMARKTPETYRLLDVERNNAWLPKVEARLKESTADDTLGVVGSLHLLGYDHVTPEQERQMFGLQRQLLLTFFALRHDANVQATLPAGTPDALALYDAAHGAGRDLDSK